MYYLITGSQAKFFPTRESAEAYRDTHHLHRSFMRVPPGATHHSVVDLRSRMRCLFYDESAEEGEKIEVES